MWHRLLRQIRHLLGRRGRFLLILGVGKICWGAGMVVDPPSTAGLQLLLAVAPLHCWALLWILAGCITGGSAFLRVGRDLLGFVVALVPPAVWALSYLVAMINDQFSRGAWVFIWYLTSHVGVILWASTVPEFSLPMPKRTRKAKAV